MSEASDDPEVCGSCIAWKSGTGADASRGACRLRPELGVVPATLKRCHLYRGRGEPARPLSAKRRSATARVVPAATPRPYQPTPPGSLSPSQVEVLRDLWAHIHAPTGRALAPRYRGGTVVITDATDGTSEFPIEALFDRVARLREDLDALSEAGAATLEGPALSELRGLLRRIHGSLTTFNLLFADPADHFSGKP